MILVDTSIWLDHFRKGNAELVVLLNNVQVLGHPFIEGEIGCGNLRNRHDVLSLLRDLPKALVAEHEEVVLLVESRKLMGQGIGWIDAHLLASALLSKCNLWTIDKNLRKLSAKLGVMH